MPRYAKGRGGAKRLWEIEVVGAGYVVRYGKPGALDEMHRTFASEAEARRAAESFIADRLKDGYVVMDADPALPEIVVPSRFREPALEEAIVAAPDDRDAYLVYADWLQQQGDVHGQLIALQAAGRPASDVLSEHGRALLGELADSVDADGQGAVQIEWRWGFADRVRLEVDRDRRRDVIQLLDHLIALPISLVLRALVFGRPYDDEFDYGDVIEGLVRLAPRLAPTLRDLTIGDFAYPDESEMSWVEVGNVAPLYAAFPGLESLTLQGGTMSLGPIEHAALRSFEVRTGGLSAADVAAIAAARWPRLERLVVWFGDDNWGGGATPADARAILDALPAGVVHLGLCNAAFTDDIVDALAAWPRLGELRGLDLSLGTLTDEGAARLAGLGDRLPALASLDVSENLLGDEAVDRLAARWPQLRAANQRDLDDERYPAVGE